MNSEPILDEKYYDSENSHLVYLGHSSSEENWDKHWDNAKTNVRNEFVSKVTKKYLPKGARILEGGCGIGDKVYTLKQDGYDVVGLDWAAKTVARIKISNPELNCIVGDVRHLPYPDSSFDGYWSLGVIEHFSEGFDAPLAEAARVVKPNGYLFLTVPAMSPLRKFKAFFGGYKPWLKPEGWELSFYQYVIAPEVILEAARRMNLEPVKVYGMDGVKGLKDEFQTLQFILGPIYNSNRLPLKVLRKCLQLILSPFSGHICLYILKKSL